MTSYEFERWLRGTTSGARCVYHEGHLAADRKAPGIKGRRVDRLADRVYAASNMEFPRISDCYHIRGWFQGSGEVALSQRRSGKSGRILYIAERL